MSDGLYKKLEEFEKRLLALDREYSNHPLWNLSEWLNDLKTARSRLDGTKEVVCGVLGSMQCGKSTLLNAVLGERILRMGEGGVCTAAITEVRYQPKTFRARVIFLSREEWEAEVDNIYSQAEPGDSTDASGEQESVEIRKDLRKRLENVYEFDSKTNELPNRKSLKEKPHINEHWESGKTETVFENERADKLYDSMGPVMATRNHLWPLIKKVEVFGPMEILKDRFAIVDLPGLGDLNPAREKLTKDYLLKINLLLVVFDSAPLISGEIRDVLVKSNIMKRHKIAGSLPYVTYVGTQIDNVADGLTEPDGLEERLTKATKEAGSKLNEILSELYGEIFEAEKPDHSINEKYFTSARESLRIDGKIRGEPQIKNKDLTRIPALFDSLKKSRASISNSGKGSAARIYYGVLEKTQFFFRSVLNEFKKLSKAEAALDEEFKAWLEKETTNIFSLFKQAYESHQVTIKQAVKKLQDNLKGGARLVVDEEKATLEKWGGMNWATLKATVVRDGNFRDSRGRRHDLIADAERGYLNLLETVWTNQATPDVCRAIKEYAVKLVHHVSTKVENALTWLEAKKATHIKSDLIKEDWDKLKRQWDYKVEIFLDNTRAQLFEKGQELSNSLNHQIRREMEPAFKKSKGISGPGTKQAILDILFRRLSDIRNRFQGQFTKEIQDIPGHIGVHAPGFTAGISKEGQSQWEMIKHNLGVHSSITDRADMEKKTKDVLNEVDALVIAEREDDDGS